MGVSRSWGHVNSVKHQQQRMWHNSFKDQLTSGKTPIALVNEGASKGTILYVASSPTLLILCSWKNTRSKGMSFNTFRFRIYKISNCPF